MIRAVGLALSLVSAPAFGQAEDSAGPVTIGPGVQSLVYGIYCPDPPERLEDAPGTAAGVVNIVPVIPQIAHVQTLVPAALGVGFGVVLQTEPGQVFDPAIVTITHPPYPDSGIEIEQWFTTLDDVGLNLVGFSFELRSELVTGPWTFAAHDGETLIFQVVFEVVPPALLPDISELCAGAFMS